MFLTLKVGNIVEEILLPMWHLQVFSFVYSTDTSGGKTMARLQQAPVVYVLGVIRFPRMVDVDRLASALHLRLRGDYPTAQPIETPHVEVAIGEEGIEVRQESIKIWQFSSLNREWAVILNPSTIGLHTVAYTDHADFISRFATCIRAASEVPEVGIEFVEAVALRYVDLIAPRAEDKVTDYVVSTVLPAELAGVADLRLQEGVHVARYETSCGNLRLQVLRRPPSVLPLELNTPVTHAIGWGLERPEGDFAIVDVDHGMTFNPPVRLDLAELEDNMMRLRGPIRAVFDGIATPHAMCVWKGEA
jgi:uncharacterized protein (TIGR04255 family)